MDSVASPTSCAQPRSPRHNANAQLPPVMPALRSTADGRQHRHRSPHPLPGVRHARARALTGAAAGFRRRRRVTAAAFTAAPTAERDRRSAVDSNATGSSMASTCRRRLRGCDRRGRDFRPLSPGCSASTLNGRVGAACETGNNAGGHASHTYDSPACCRDAADRKCHSRIANHGARNNRTGRTDRACGGARRGRNHD
jgi:hypothetical protein